MRIDQVLDSGPELVEAEGGCHNCPRNLVDHVPPTHTDGEILALGEAPGGEEVEEGEGFIGSSGQRLRRFFVDAGLADSADSFTDDIALANTILCRPPGDRDPTGKEVRCCLNQFVIDVIEQYRVIVLVGGTATRALFPGKKPSHLRGNVCRHPDFPGKIFYPMYHPAWVGYQNDQGESAALFREQVERLARIVDGDRPDMEIHRPSEDGWIEGLEQALAAPRISYDIETNQRLESWAIDSRMVSFALTADGRNVYFCTEDDPPWIGAMERLKRALTQPDKQVIGHNLGFDLEWTESEVGFKTQARWTHDTQMLYRHVGGHQMASLKFLVSRYLDGYRYLVPEPGEDTDPDLLAKYNAEDVIYPYRLFKEGFTELNADQRDLYLTVASDTSLFARRLTARGMSFNEQRSRELQDELRDELWDVLDEWREDDPDLELGFVVHVEEDEDSGEEILRIKNKELREYLYEVKDLPVVAETDTGLPAADKEALWVLQHRHGADWIEYLKRIRSLNKNRSTFTKGYRKRVSNDGRLHTRFLNAFTKTGGRFSSRDPNLQNAPRGERFRSQFDAPTGWMLSEVDYSQAEFRVMVSAAGDETGIEAYRQGQDVHARTAMQITGKDGYTKEERDNSKIVNFAHLYGGDENTLQRQARVKFGVDWDLDRCERFSRTFFNTYSDLEDYHDEIRQQLRTNEGWIRQPVGHWEYYDNWDHPKDRVRERCEREVINAMGQGTAGYMTLLLGIEIDRRVIRRGEWRNIRPTSTVHDSVIAEVKEGHFHTFTEIAREANEVVGEWVRDWFEVPLVLDVAVGPDWGHLEELEREQITALSEYRADAG